MRNKAVIKGLVAAALFGCAACSRQEEAADLTPEPGYLIVTDFLNRSVKVKENPEHVGSLFAVASHIVAMLGEADSLVTIPQGNVRDLLFCEIYPQIRAARVVKGNNVINIEEIAKPPRAGIFFTNPEVSLDSGQMRQLRKLKTPVVTIAYSTIEQQLQMVELIGTVLDRNEEAAAYVSYCRTMMTRIAERTAGIPDREKKSVYHAINELLRTDQRGTLSADWISRIGVRNIALEDRPDGRFTINKNYIPLEELLQKNPDCIIINGGDVLDYIESNPQLHHLKAYRNGNIHLLPLGVSRWGHPYSIETPLAMLWTAKAVYPERFADVDMEKETRDFYRTFFGCTLTDRQLATILSGRGYKEIKGSGR